MVVMPTTAPAVKVEGASRLGAEVVFEGTTSLHRKARAEAMADAEGLTMVPPFDHPAIIAGQGTAGREIALDWPEVEEVLVPIGGGGLVVGHRRGAEGTGAGGQGGRGGGGRSAPYADSLWMPADP